MQVIFIHQSCFLVEVDDKVLIFDYIGQDSLDGFHFTGKIPDYEPNTKIYVFASQHHPDHFDPEILTWYQKYPEIKYIISKDCDVKGAIKKQKLDRSQVMEHVKLVTSGNKYEIDDEMTVQTLRSTNGGVGFYLNTNGFTMYHAGDLNDWYMEGAGELINGAATRAYRREIGRLKDKPINIACVVVDPHLGTDQARGLDYFLKNTDAEFVFPMHMYQDYSGIAQYKKRISNLGYANRIIDISRENQIFPFGE